MQDLAPFVDVVEECLVEPQVLVELEEGQSLVEEEEEVLERLLQHPPPPPLAPVAARLLRQHQQSRQAHLQVFPSAVPRSDLWRKERTPTRTAERDCA